MQLFWNTYKYWLIGFLVLVILSYVLAFRKTFDLQQKYRLLGAKAALYNEAPNRIESLRAMETSYNKFLSAYNLNTTSSNNGILKAINLLSSENLVLINEFTEPHIYEDTVNQKRVITYRFQLKGPYSDILNLIYGLEQQYTFGNITHINFEKTKNYRRGSYELFCAIHLQRLEAL